MDKKQIRLSKLSVILILVAIFVFLATLIASKTIIEIAAKDKESLVSKRITRKKAPTLASELNLPRIEDVDDEVQLEEEPLAEGTEEEPEPEEVELQALPLEKLAPEQLELKLEDAEEEGTVLKTQPPLEELKGLKKKGVIIF